MALRQKELEEIKKRIKEYENGILSMRQYENKSKELESIILQLKQKLDQQSQQNIEQNNENIKKQRRIQELETKAKEIPFQEDKLLKVTQSLDFT